MNSLTEICELESIEGIQFEQLRECINYTQSFEVTLIEGIVIGIAAILCALIAGFGRKKVIPAIEGLFLAILAGYAGSVAGLLFAEILPPWLMGIWLFFCAGATALLCIIGLWSGNGTIGWKIFGGIISLFLISAFVTVGIFCYATLSNSSIDYQNYLNAVTWLFILAAVIDTVFIASHGSYHGVYGWLLVLINASWGALGNLLGIVHHLISWSCYRKHGDIKTNARSFYTNYNDGLRLRSGFAFTQAAVMTGPPVEKHESHHVLQHFIFGPIFTVSYLLWFIPGAIIGLVIGLVKGKGFNGVEAWAYFNNPWEIWAYAVQGGRSQSGSVGTSLIWGKTASWIIAVLYFLISTSVFVLLLYLRH